MTRLIQDGRKTAKTALHALYAPITVEMQQVEALLTAELTSRYPAVDAMTRYGCMLGGKRLRPALLLLAGRAVGTLQHDHVVLGAVVEMIHTATLVHDDVLDHAEVRRHNATVNRRWDAKSAILLGDYLFTHAFYLASTLDSTFACRTIGQATNLVCEGEMRQNASCRQFDLHESEYLSIINAKTAELCACSCLLGAHYAGADEQLAQQMSDYGRCLGMAFQIVDDVLDVAGDEDAVGKSLGTDIEQAKPTLPLIRLWAQANDGERDELRRILKDPVTASTRLRPWLQGSDAVDYARGAAQDLADKALAIASELPESPAQEILAALPHFVVQRQY